MSEFEKLKAILDDPQVMLAIPVAARKAISKILHPAPPAGCNGHSQTTRNVQAAMDIAAGVVREQTPAHAYVPTLADQPRRDQFALQAMSELCVEGQYDLGKRGDAVKLAKAAYYVADAMLCVSAQPYATSASKPPRCPAALGQARHILNEAVSQFDDDESLSDRDYLRSLLTTLRDLVYEAQRQWGE